MEVSKVKLHHRVIAFDFTSSEYQILISEDFKVYRNGVYIPIHASCTIKDPIIKTLSESLFLLIDREFENENIPNAWIIDIEGRIVNAFFVDSPFQVDSTKNHIVMSYSDAMLDIDSKFGNAQLVVFDYNGNCLFEYNSSDNHTEKVSFLENKAFFKKDDETLYFMPYIGEGRDFPVIELDLKDFSTNVLFFARNDFRSDIDNLKYFVAFSNKNQDWYFLGQKTSDNEHTRIYKIDTNMVMSEIYSTGSYLVSPKGIDNGAFVAASIENGQQFIDTIKYFEIQKTMHNKG